jgi:hypothetical protein
MYHRESTSATRHAPTKYGYPLPKALQMQKPNPAYSHPLVPRQAPQAHHPSQPVPPTFPTRPNAYCSNGNLPCFMKNFQ